MWLLLLPRCDAGSLRCLTQTFRSKTSTFPSPLSSIRRPRLSAPSVRVLTEEEASVKVAGLHDSVSSDKRSTVADTAVDGSTSVFVGRMPGVHQRPRGFKVRRVASVLG